ncbi:MAG: LegC family aminotransferase [Alistipes sp.]
MNNNDFTTFVREMYEEPEGVIILHDPRFIGNERKYLNDALDTNYVSSVGEYVGRFETMCAQYTGAKYAVATMNGTSALHISLLLAGVERGEEVITQPLTFIATANAISYTGAKCVFVDVDRDTMGLSPSKLEQFLHDNVQMKAGKAYNKTTGKRFAAVVPMHTFGHPCRIDEIAEVCKKYNIALVEDAAESIGTRYKGKHTGLFGLVGALSFNGNKIITTGGGGMILTDDEQLAKLAKHITTTAKMPHRWAFNHDMVAYNYRLTNLAAALGCGQIENLEFFVEQKRLLADKYKKFFAAQTDVQFVTEPKDARSNYWFQTIILKDAAARDEFLTYTNDQGVMTRPIWTLMNRLEMYKECQTGDLSNAEWLEARVVNITSTVFIKDYYKKLRHV